MHNIIIFFKHILPPKTKIIIGFWLSCVAIITAFHDFTNWISKDVLSTTFEFSLILLLVAFFINSCIDRYNSTIKIDEKNHEISELKRANNQLKENREGLIEQTDNDKIEIEKFRFLFQQQQDYNKFMISYIPTESLTELKSRMQINQLIQKDDDTIG